MATMQGLVDRTRQELVDPAVPFQASVAGDGKTVRFELPDKPVSAVGLVVVRRNDTTGTTTEITGSVVDEHNGVVTVPFPIAVGESLVVRGTSYRFFTDAQIEGFVTSALDKHNHMSTVTLGTLPKVEEHLVAILAKIEALWVLLTDSSYDIDVFNPEGVSIHRSQRRRMLMDQIAVEQDRYNRLAQQLNVGIGRVVIGNLRRVSTRTGRFVPLYVSQEIDDIRRPQRMYPAIDQQSTTERPAHLPALPADASTLPDTNAPSLINLQIYPGDSFMVTLDTERDLTDHTAVAEIFLNGVLHSEFAVAYTDRPGGYVTLSLTTVETAALPAGCDWYLRVFDADDNRETVAQGDVVLLSTVP